MTSIKGFFRGRTSIQPIWVFVIALFIFFSLMSEYFLSFGNVTNILVQTSTIGLIALGMTLVMINGNIDLSVGAILGLAASLAVGLQEISMTLAILAALGSGILLGAINGLIVWKTGVNAFIVTLGAMLGIRGLIFLYTGEQSFYALNFAFSDFGTSTIGPFPVLAVIFLICTLIMHLVLTRTGHGRNTFAVGGNPEASIDAGIRLGRHMMINFIIVGFFAALAGVMLASQMGAATPNLGRDYELWVITAVVLGGTKLTGGYGSIVGTLGGVLAIGILRNGMNLMQVPAFYVLVILGAILISVLIIDKKLNAPSTKEVRI
ncbi:ABC transporter permease [Vreelandella neptunia]|jgi:ribose transport system permease protein|uniref:ABC transporter permease n=1 Tax=Vreelandella neptunia TaxID=115551 RepID=A0ABZ0YSX0_9GAMM|nr:MULTISPECIES: ABC transporter permease [Halomonas]MBL1267441.1 ABC transporter permease [Halomonas sp.]MDN3562659.1 ABC transporter permease [Halomonas neptunia]WQH14853.1 ABC transporter permease [Halomonas neptunia]